MRRKGHPSRPRAITCCFFASLKTLLIPTKATALRRNQRPRASFSLAGFQVTLIGRFWVTAEAFLFRQILRKARLACYAKDGVLLEPLSKLQEFDSTNWAAPPPLKCIRRSLSL